MVNAAPKPLVMVMLAAVNSRSSVCQLCQSQLCPSLTHLPINQSYKNSSAVEISVPAVEFRQLVQFIAGDLIGNVLERNNT